VSTSSRRTRVYVELMNSRLLRLSALVLLLWPFLAQAQNPASTSQAARRALLAAQANQAASAQQLQPIDASAAAALDRGVHTDLLEQCGDPSEPGVPPSAEMQTPLAPPFPPRRNSPGREARPGGRLPSNSIPATDEATTPSPEPMFLPAPAAANESASSAFPLHTPTSRKPARAKAQPPRARPASTTRLARACLDSINCESPAPRLASSAGHSSHARAPSSQPQAHTRRPHHRSTASPFATPTSSQ